MNISNHAKQRYAERIMNKKDVTEISRFISLNEEKINTDINKMIEYGKLIYTGKSASKEYKGNIIDVYLKDCWIVLVDVKSSLVITLYKVDFGLDEEFNKSYINKMVDKLVISQQKLNEVKKEIEEESNLYLSMIEDSESQIKEYKTIITKLENLVSSYKEVIENNNVKELQAEQEVFEIINSLISKKEF